MGDLRDFLNSDKDTYEFEKPYTIDGDECRMATVEEIATHLNNKVFYNSRLKLIAISVVILFAVVYQLFFRYEYKLYNIPGTYNYRVKEVKLDKLTGKAQLKIIDPTIEKYSHQTTSSQQIKGSGLYDDLLDGEE